MKPKVIHTEADHEAALQRIDALMENDPAPNSPEGEELELLSVLVERYEEKKYPMDMPTPVEAIKFRMEQQGLKPKHLVQYLGSPSKVSEILNGKRPLTLAMIRRLHDGLGIPAEVLIGENFNPPVMEVPVEKFPVKAMYERGWFDWFAGNWNQAREQA